MKMFRTNEIPHSRRVEFWNELCGSFYSPITIDPLRPDHFNGELQVDYDDVFRVSRFRTTPVSMERSRKHTLAAQSTGLTAFMRLDGHASFTIGGKQMDMAPGNVILFDAHTAFNFVANEDTAALAIGIPDNFVSAHLPNVDKVVGRMFNELTPMFDLIVGTMQQIQRQSGEGRVPSPKLLRGMLELISAAADDEVITEEQSAGSAHAQRWMRRAMTLITAQLSDPRLKAGSLANALGISPRYLRLIFAEKHESVTQVIQRMRLDESARCLLNPDWKDVPLADLAYRWGFEDPAYFSRCFKARFGTTPTLYRLGKVN